jgi:hypothetical protein
MSRLFNIAHFPTNQSDAGNAFFALGRLIVYGQKLAVCDVFMKLR